MRDHLNHKMYIIGSWQPFTFCSPSAAITCKMMLFSKGNQIQNQFIRWLYNIYPKGQIWRPWLALPWQLRPRQPSLFAAGGGVGRPCWGWWWGWCWWWWWWWCWWKWGRCWARAGLPRPASGQLRRIGAVKGAVGSSLVFLSSLCSPYVLSLRDSAWTLSFRQAEQPYILLSVI